MTDIPRLPSLVPFLCGAAVVLAVSACGDKTPASVQEAAGALTGGKSLAFDDGGPEALLSAGRRAHAPYSGCPGAVLFVLDDGTEVTGSGIESVAFNPTMQPVMAAMIELTAMGLDAGRIRTAWLGTVRGGAVDYTATTTELLARVAPGVALRVAGWR